MDSKAFLRWPFNDNPGIACVVIHHRDLEHPNPYADALRCHLNEI
jgi:hypothetical protein